MAARPAGQTRDHDRLGAWCGALDVAYPGADAADWDQVGLHVGDPDGDVVTGVLVALDVTAAVLDEAKTKKANLLVVHHPLLFAPLARLTPQTAAGRLALRAARQGCAVFAAHTNLDAALPGTSHPSAIALGLIDTRPIKPVDSPVRDPIRGMGLVGTLPDPLPLRAVAERLATGLPAPGLRVATADLDQIVRTVAVCGGAGDSYIADLMPTPGLLLADVYVTGDLRHHPTLDALTMGLNLIDAGHHATENPAMDGVIDRLESLRAEYDLRAPIHRSLVDTDPWTHWSPHQ